MEHTHYSEQEQVRRNALKELMELGINPYPAHAFPVDTSAAQILEGYDPEKGNFQKVTLAGRIMSRRIMGAASFMVLQDHTGRIQIYVKRDEICPEEDKTLYNTVFKKLMDIGDIVGVTGYAFITKTGEISVHAQELTLLSKSLRVLPIVKEKEDQVYDAFTDPEQRYRMRYVDLIVNPHVRETFVQRTRMVNAMRDFSTASGIWKWKPLFYNPFPAELMHVLSKRTTMHSIFPST